MVIQTSSVLSDFWSAVVLLVGMGLVFSTFCVEACRFKAPLSEQARDARAGIYAALGSGGVVMLAYYWPYFWGGSLFG